MEVVKLRRAMIDLAKAIHEAIGIESPRTFIALFALFGLLVFAALGWLIDTGYRVKLKEQAKLMHAGQATAQPPLGVTSDPSPTGKPPEPPLESQPHSMSTPKNEPLKPESQKPKSIHIEQNQSPGSVAVVGDGNTVLSPEASLIRSLELHVDLDLPTESSEVTPKLSSVGLQNIAMLIDAQKNPHRLVTDYQYVDWQVQNNLHRFGFVYKPENMTEMAGRRITMLSQMDVLVINYADFVKMALHTPLLAESATANIKVVLNGIEVMHHHAKAAIGTITGGPATVDVSEGFKRIEAAYRLQLLNRAGR